MGAVLKHMFFKKGSDKIPTSEISTSLWNLEINDLAGNKTKLGDFTNDKTAFVFVNVACKCGLTSENYKELVEMYENHKNEGLQIFGFPCGQFMNQELSSEEDIRKFIDDNYKVSFPMFAKIEVNGQNTHPIYKYLKFNSAQMNTGNGLKNIPWNFAKFLVDKNGQVIGFYEPNVKPSDIFKDIQPLLRKDL